MKEDTISVWFSKKMVPYVIQDPGQHSGVGLYFSESVGVFI